MGGGSSPSRDYLILDLGDDKPTPATYTPDNFDEAEGAVSKNSLTTDLLQ